jgi:hypothetical protein
METSMLLNLFMYMSIVGACGGAVVKALHYKPEGHRIDSHTRNNFLEVKVAGT